MIGDVQRGRALGILARLRYLQRPQRQKHFLVRVRLRALGGGLKIGHTDRRWQIRCLTRQRVERFLARKGLSDENGRFLARNDVLCP